MGSLHRILQRKKVTMKRMLIPRTRVLSLPRLKVHNRTALKQAMACNPQVGSRSHSIVCFLYINQVKYRLHQKRTLSIQKVVETVRQSDGPNHSRPLLCRLRPQVGSIFEFSLRRTRVTSILAVTYLYSVRVKNGAPSVCGVVTGKGKPRRKGKKSKDDYMATDEDEPRQSGKGSKRKTSNGDALPRNSKRAKKEKEKAEIEAFIEESCVEADKGEIAWCPLMHPNFLPTLYSEDDADTESMDIPEEAYKAVVETSMWNEDTTLVTVDYLTTPPADLLARYINPQRIADLKNEFNRHEMHTAKVLVVTNHMSEKLEKLYNQYEGKVRSVESRYPGTLCNLMKPTSILEECARLESAIPLDTTSARDPFLAIANLRQQQPSRYQTERNGLEDMPLWWRTRYTIWMLDSTFRTTVTDWLKRKAGKDPPVQLYILAGNHSTAAAKEIDPNMYRNSLMYLDILLQQEQALYIAKRDNEALQRTAEYTGQSGIDRPFQFRAYWEKLKRPQKKDVDRTGGKRLFGWKVRMRSIFMSV